MLRPPSVIFVEDRGPAFCRNPQRHAVVRRKRRPELFRKLLRGQVRDFAGNRRAGKGRQRGAEALVGADKMSLAGDGGVIKKRAVAADAVPGAEDGELIPPARKADGGDPGGKIRLVRLESPGAQRVVSAAPAQKKIADGVGLVAVGDDERAAGLPHGMIEDETGVGHFALVEGAGADAVLRPFKNPVAAVFTAAHDEIGGYRVPIRGRTDEDAPPGVGPFAQIVK